MIGVGRFILQETFTFEQVLGIVVFVIGWCMWLEGRIEGEVI